MKDDFEMLNYIKKIDISILLKFKNICEENNLQYYLAFGTLLGAVRHNGFIPWDDDIDVWMPRKDYEKFLILTKKIKIDDCYVLSFRNNDKYLFPWAKMCDSRSLIIPSRFSNGFEYGISIDIFPLDFISGNGFNECLDNAKSFNRQYKSKYVKKYFVYNGYSLKKSITKYLVKKIGFIFSTMFFSNKKSILKSIDDELISCSKNKCDYVSYVYDLVSDVFAIDYSKFEGNRKLLFENEFFSVPSDYDYVLKCIYGDYMKLPPIEKQVSHHDFECILKKGEK